MTLFWSIAFALLVLAMWLVGGTLLRASALRRATLTASQSNLAVLKAQWQQLDQELADGSIDSAQHALARDDIERRVLEEENIAAAPERTNSPRPTLLLLLVSVPVLALGIYGLLGSPHALQPQAVAAAGEPTEAEMNTLVARLAERMQNQPPGQVADAAGWIMLGRSYAAMQRFAEARSAFERALQLTPNDAQVLADAADAMAMQQGRSLQGEPMRLVERALASDPSNLKALALAGSAAFERNDHAAALQFWNKARAVAPADSEFSLGLERAIEDARKAQGMSAPNAASAAAAGTAAQAHVSAAASGPAAAAAPVPGAASVSGRVSLAPALAARVAAGDTLFVFARAAQGPRMPLAILKRSAGELPFTFTLDDSMAMTPQLKLSNFGDVVIGARISKSGNATPQSGDLEGQSAASNGRSAGIDVLIDKVRP